MCAGLKIFWGLLSTSNLEVVVVVQLTRGRTRLRRHRRVRVRVQPQVPGELFEHGRHRLWGPEVLVHLMGGIHGALALRFDLSQGEGIAKLKHNQRGCGERGQGWAFTWAVGREEGKCCVWVGACACG